MGVVAMMRSWRTKAAPNRTARLRMVFDGEEVVRFGDGGSVRRRERRVRARRRSEARPEKCRVNERADNVEERERPPSPPRRLL